MAVRDYIRERFFPHIWCPGCGHGIVLEWSATRDREYGIEEERHRDGVGDRLFVADCGICGFSYAAHDTRAGAGVCHRGEDEPSGADAFGADGRRRCTVDRGEPLHPCLPAEHRHDGDRDEQPGLRNDGRAVFAAVGVRHPGDDGPVYEYRLRNSMWSTWRRRQGPRLWRAPHPITFSRLADVLEEAIRHKGFSVVEVMSPCPTYFGRKNKEGSAVDMMEKLKTTTTPIGSKAKQENPSLIETGGFREEGDAGVLCRVSEDH